MSNRPLLQQKIDYFERYIEANYWSLPSLEVLADELKYRNGNTYPRYGALDVRASRRIEQLRRLHNLLKELFRNAIFNDWFKRKGEPGVVISDAVTTGRGPLDESDFDELLLEHRITPHFIGSDLGTVIVGQENWNAEELLEQLAVRNNKSIKIYSQEMMLAYLACGKDPFDDDEVLKYFGREHPALQFLMNIGFNWPSSFAGPSSYPLPEINWPKQGMLSYLNYKVGRAGPVETKRRKILSTIYETEVLPNLNSRTYMEQWGRARSDVRLQKLANCIAAFTRNAKRNDPEKFEISIKHWESDLEWLKLTFYAGRYQFYWPSTFVGDEYRKV